MRPQTTLDLQICMQERLELAPNEFERYFDVEGQGDRLVLAIHRDTHGKRVWLERTIWTAVNNYVRELGGVWAPKQGLWEIPISPGAKTSPPAAKPKAYRGATGEPATSVTAHGRMDQALSAVKKAGEHPVPLTKPTKVSAGRARREAGEGARTLDREFAVIPVKALLSLPFQVRSWGPDPGLAQMAETIRTHGLLQPLVVRPRADGLYEVVNGERRLKAAEMAGLTEVPCVVKKMGDREAYECQMIENVQRKDLADIEKARWLDYMLKKFPGEYPTQEALAKRLGKTQGWVAQHLRMLDLEKDEIITRVIKPEELTEGQARAILQVPEEKRREVAEKIAEYIKSEGEAPSMHEIRRFVKPEVSPAAIPVTPGVTKEPERQPIHQGGYEDAPSKETPHEEVPEGTPIGEKDKLLDKAIHYYGDLTDVVYERITDHDAIRKAISHGFMRFLVEAEHTVIVNRGFLDEAWDAAKDAFEKASSEVRQI